MRVIRYKTHWSYSGPAVSRRKVLSHFVLDILYLMEMHGVVPPIEVLNEVLQTGGNSGGMGPGTTWRPFTVTKEEYDELVDALLTADINNLKQQHPYVKFERVILDKEPSEIKEYQVWQKSSFQKYCQ